MVGSYGFLAAGLISLVQASLPARVSPVGFTSPEAGARLVGGTVVDIAWTRSADTAPVQEMELVLSMDGGQTFPVRVTRALESRSTGVAWRVPNLLSVEVRLALRAGVEGREQILFLSPDFTIRADPTARLDSLVALEGELWTREALDGRQVYQLSADNLGNARERVSSGIPADASLDDPDSHLFFVPTPPSTALHGSVSVGSVASDAPPEFAVRVSLPKRE